MTDSDNRANFPRIEGLLEAPVLYCDNVPTIGLRQGVVGLTLAVSVGELISKTDSTDHLLAVADVRMPMATAIKLRDVLSQMILTATGKPDATN
jgi:hypothetical protein